MAILGDFDEQVRNLEKDERARFGQRYLTGTALNGERSFSRTSREVNGSVSGTTEFIHVGVR